ncbi:MAG: TlpA family protein disulfide reductase [Planctomycetes bacterium]|nr:TlpA family protein disulfide reductase [Planctomycetota bacterium]MCG2682324.1 TlpA family protein disulfide reductase [Planctomycetales bacterium]
MCGEIRGLWLMVPCLAALAAWPLMAAEEKKEPADAPAAEKTNQEKPTEEKPSGEKTTEEKTSEEKKEEEKVDPFIVPEGTPEELVEYIDKVRKTPLENPQMVVKARRALRRAAEHIIAAQPEEKQMTHAVQLKMQLLGDQEQLAGFAEELKEDGHEKYARMVRNFGLQIELAKTERQDPRNQKKAIGDVLRFLEESPPEQADSGLALMAGKMAELTGDNQYASEVYRSAAKAFAAGKDEKLAEFARTLAGTSRRLALLGNEIRIEGRLLDGGTFDWSKYAGKVVLVDFWSTWSGSSVADLSKMKKYYDRYHDKGFDIVGISCDQRLADLEKFVKKRDIPWAIVYGKDKPSPSVAYYGVTDIPTKILVGRDGKVMLLNARGLKLKEELLKLFGPAEKKK